MLIEFKVSNFRSIKDEAILSMVAEPSKSKSMNYWEQELADSDPIRLLKVAAIYGPNASGKSNLLRAMYNLRRMLTSPAEAGGDIHEYEPFSFDLDTREAPSVFDLTFVGPENVKYRYMVKYDAHFVHEEVLEYYPIGNQRILFHRLDDDEDELITLVKMGHDYRNKRIKVFRNQLLLSKFGAEEADEQLSAVFVNLKKLLVVNACSELTLRTVRRLVINALANEEHLHVSLDQLIRNADIKIKGTEIKEQIEAEYKFPEDFPKEERAKIIQKFKYQVFGLHDLYQNRELVGTEKLPLEDESHGTNTMFMLGGLILLKMKEGGIIFVDELDTSLHPDLTRMLVQLFQMETTNPKNAQLVFTTHDTNLMDSALLRKDQVWFAEKDEYGATDFFSLQDFDSVRETTPFEKWYGAGKFGAKPNISDLAF
jgi:hypothetical protein